MENYVEFYSIHITLNVFLIKFGVKKPTYYFN